MNQLPYSITYICMEPSRPAAVARAIAPLNEWGDLPVRLILHAHESGGLIDERRRGTIAGHLAGSALVVISHVMLDEETTLLEGLVREHVRTDATIIVISSAAPLMRLTRVGEFRMKSRKSDAEQEKKPSHLRTLLKTIIGGRNIAPHLKDLMILAPRLLKYLPGKAGDLRSYIECYLYSIESSDRNIRSMFLMLADRYHAPLRGKLAGDYTPPVIYPSEGMYHPDAAGIFSSREEYWRWYAANMANGTDRTDMKIRPINPMTPQHHTAPPPTIGLLLLRGNIISDDTAAIDATIRAFEARGIRVIPAFSGSFDFRIAIEKMMLDSSGSGIDAIVSLTAFPLVGGHVQSDPATSVAALERYGLPYFAPVALHFQIVSEWRDSDYGLNPVQTALHVALPELDGAIEPIITSGVEEGAAGKHRIAIEERTAKLVRRVERWLALRHKASHEKRIAITIFAFPPNRGAVGTAAYLDVFRSLFNLLVRLKSEGYSVELPSDYLQLIDDIVGGNVMASHGSAELNIAATMEVEEYERLAPDAKRVEAMWGKPPGTLNSDGRRLNIHGRRYGNIFIGVQPSFGFEGDPMRLLFARGASPHHGFLAYYTWIEKVFAADAHLHFGTHGALEFMPGKQVGLDRNCWPDILIGDLPNIYYYSINNPSEGTIAKRRSLATIVSYLTPPLENAGLYRELATMKGMVDEYRTAQQAEGRRISSVEALVEKVDALHLDKDVPLPSSPADYDAFIARLYTCLLELETRLIPTGLHVLDEAPPREELADLLLAVGEYDRPDHGIRALTEVIASTYGTTYQELYRQAEAGDLDAAQTYTTIRRIALDAIRSMLDSADPRSGSDTAVDTVQRGLASARPDVKSLRSALGFLLRVADRAVEQREGEALLQALRGSYIPAAIGSDPVRVPEALPSGRNIHSLDPSAVPSASALRNAERVVDLLLQKKIEETGRLPESIGMVLWGLDNIKTHGEAIAQVFVLIGVRPVADSIGRISRLDVVPLAELGRPRIDVTIEASGIFRDIFGLQLELLDDAFHRVASLDEPEEMNFVRKHTRALSRRLSLDESTAATRIFSNAAGAYGTNIDSMVGMSAWKERGDLAEVFLRRKSFAYGKRRPSVEARHILEELAAGIDTTFQNLDSSEVGITDVDHYFEYIGGLTAVVEQRSGARPTALVADTTTARAKVRTLEATIRLEARTKLLNPRWYEGMLSHGYQGVEEIRKRLDYTFGFSATADAVENWVYDRLHETYVDDAAMRERMSALNIHAYTGLVRRLSEAAERGFWSATDDQRQELQEIEAGLEDAIEGVK